MKLSTSFFAFLAVCLFVPLLGFGQAVGDYRSAGTGNWNTLGTWERLNSIGPEVWATPTPVQGYPGENAGTGLVTITDGDAVTLDVSPAEAIGSLAIGSSDAASDASLTFGGAYSLTVTGNTTIRSNNGNGTKQISVNAGTLTIGGNLRVGTGAQGSGGPLKISALNISTGTVTVSGNTTIETENRPEHGQIIFTDAGTLNFGGTFSVISNSGNKATLTPSTGTVNFNSTTTAQNIPLVSNISYNNLTINNTSLGGATLGNPITATNVTGNLSVQSGIFSNGNKDITLASGKNFSVSDGATFSLTGTSSMVVVSGGAKTFGATSTVNYAGSTQTVTGETYGNLNFSGGLKTLPAATINVAGNFTTAGNGGTSAATNPINITGDVSLSGGPAAFNAGSATITVGGSWNKAGANSFTQGTSTVIFKDSPDIEVISGASTTFYNLTIDGSTISLDKKIEVQNTFSLLNENLILNNFSLTLSNATGLSGGSSSSYVVTNGTGRFIRTIGGSGTYLFPLGSAAGYDQATMTWSSSPGATQISSNFNSTPLINPTGLTSTIYGGIEPTPITEFLDNGYWDFTADVTPNVFDLTLVADAVNNMGANDSFHSIFRSPNTGASGWTDAGTSPVPSAFSTSTITLQMSGVTFMRFYGIGRSEEYILPIVLVDFDGSNVGNANVLNWTTATELNNDYFTIERSLDGKSYEEIGTVAGAGQSSTLLNYEYTDAQPYLGTNYYRLKQTDYNGAFDYSNVISIKVNGNFEMGYPYPNPVVNNVSMNILSANSGITYLRIFDMTGREMYAEKIAVNEG
ncbi:MAG: hypothetical protein KBB37_12445, partial [Bacteroidia bacterium]|nr:hypothetical protein [Bacteroidia bacterium]